MDSLKIKYFSKFINGYAFKSELYTDIGIFITRITNVDDGILNKKDAKFYPVEYKKEYEQSILKENDILISLTGNVGLCGIVKKDFLPAALNQRVGCIRVNNNRLNVKYVFYCLQNPKFIEECIVNSVGTAQLNLSTNWLKNYSLPIVDIKKQEQIVNYLNDKCSKIDKAIEDNKKQIELIDEYKKSIISQLTTYGIKKQNTRQTKCYLGEIPEDWELKKLKNIVTYIGGYAFKSEKFSKEGKYQVLRIGNIKNDLILLNANPVFINEEYTEQSKAEKIQENDILFSMTGTKGKQDYFYTLIVNKDDARKSLYINQRVGAFRRNSEDIYMPYLNYLLKNKNIKDYIFLNETGTANQGNLGIEDLKPIIVPIPSQEEQKQIVEVINKKLLIFDKLLLKRKQIIEKLEEYKKSLIYEVVTGKKEV